MEPDRRHDLSPYPLLVVDHDRQQRSTLETSLKSAGYPVTVAENGREALGLFTGGCFPLVIVDRLMPGMDGLQVCRAIREQAAGHGTFIILTTSLNTEDDLIAGREAGADDYLVKPVHPLELTARLSTATRILALESSLVLSREENRRLSSRDAATGLYNRSYLEERIRFEIKRAYRYEHSLALLMIAVNPLEVIRSAHGQAVTDAVLGSCSRCLAETVRCDVDWLARYDEERFVVVLPETDAGGALVLARRIRAKMAALTMEGPARGIRVTAVMGLAGFTAGSRTSGMSAPILLEKACSALASAREEGHEVINGVQLLG